MRHLDADAFRLLVESTVDYAIFMLDVDGRIVSWNRGAQRIKGYTADEIVGRHFSVFYPPEAVARQGPQRELEMAARDGRFEDEGWRVRKDGSLFWANVIITPVYDAHGRLQGFGKVTRDISQRREHEERIATLSRELEARVRQLDETNRELAERNLENESFVYGVSHDLRSPLVNLQGFSQELSLASAALRQVLNRPGVPEDVQAQANRLISGELEESIGFIRAAVKHLGRIIDALLRLSRVGRIEYDCVPVDMQDVVSEILAAMHTTIGESGARIVVGPLPVVLGDRNAIGQVFANLVGNAVKSFDERRPGSVEITASSARPPVFAVRDNGIGIPLEYQPGIFRVFQQVHPRRGRNQGEGMGLAIVRRIVERHGGRIWFESQPGQGTTFFFTLAPAAPPDAGAASETEDD